MGCGFLVFNNKQFVSKSKEVDNINFTIQTAREL